MKVADGDCVSKVAADSGFRDYHSVYDDGANSALKSRRTNPNCLAVDDVLVVPDKKEKSEERQTTNTWKFVVKTVKPVKLRVLLIDRDDAPIANCTWTLSGVVAASGKTGANGIIEKEIPANATNGVLTCKIPEATKNLVKAPGTPPKPPKASEAEKYPPHVNFTEFKDKAPDPKPTADATFTLKIGSLGAHDEAAGAKARLNNLGFLCVPATATPTQTTAAVKAYQRKYKKAESGATADIQADLKSRHDNP